MCQSRCLRLPAAWEGFCDVPFLESKSWQLKGRILVPESGEGHAKALRARLGVFGFAT